MTDQPTLRQSARIWGKIGILSFGGPAAQVAMMHKEIVEDRSWLGERQFLNALNFCMLLPGPEAMQLAIQDTKNKPDIMSISWAGSEYNYTPLQVSQLNELFYEAALLGITVLAASGDHGALIDNGIEADLGDLDPTLDWLDAASAVAKELGEKALWHVDNDD